jgi:hypothetical protein
MIANRKISALWQCKQNEIERKLSKIKRRAKGDEERKFNEHVAQIFAKWSSFAQVHFTE